MVKNRATKQAVRAAAAKQDIPYTRALAQVFQGPGSGIEMTPEEKARAASDKLYEQEDYLRSMRYLSDEQLRDQLRARLREEKKWVDEWLAKGDCFLISRTWKVHLPKCPSMHRLLDRESAWAPYFDDLEHIRNWHGGDNGPELPNLMSRRQVESLKRYTACAVCAPALDHADKRSDTPGWVSLRAGRLKSHHFGVGFKTADGLEIGALLRVSRVETSNGLEFRAEFEGSDEPLIDPGQIVLYRKKPSTDVATQPGHTTGFRI